MIPVRKMIEALEELEEQDPEAMLVVTESGYYADPPFAEIHEKPERVAPYHYYDYSTKPTTHVQVDTTHIYSVGHSHQSY